MGQNICQESQAINEWPQGQTYSKSRFTIFSSQKRETFICYPTTCFKIYSLETSKSHNKEELCIRLSFLEKMLIMNLTLFRAVSMTSFGIFDTSFDANTRGSKTEHSDMSPGSKAACSAKHPGTPSVQ